MPSSETIKQLTDPIPVLIPLVNPNEPEALLAELHVREGQRVTRGNAICTLETTKSTAEVLAEADGFIVGLRFYSGLAVRAGETLCYLADNPDWRPASGETGSVLQQESFIQHPEGVRITQPALALARQWGIDLEQLPRGPLITAGGLREFLDASESAATRQAAINTRDLSATGDFDPSAILVYGGGGHGKSLIDLLRSLGSYRIVGVVDDGLEKGGMVMEVPLLGGVEALAEVRSLGVRLAANAVGGVGDVNVRIQVFQRLAGAGFACPSLIHPQAFVEPSARLAGGAQVFPRAYVGSQSEVGFGVIVNTAAVVSHDCLLEDYAIISPGAILAGGVRVGEGALVGMGVTVNLGVAIGAGARLGNGSTVKSDVPPMGIVRAGAIWPD